MSVSQPRAADRLAFGDPDTFARFYIENVNRVVVFFGRRVLTVHVAWDLTAETFAVALDKSARCRAKTSEEEQGWLFAIARSQLSEYLRRGHVERKALQRLGLEHQPLTSEEFERVERMVDAKELGTRLSQSIDRLPDRQGKAVHQRVVLERDYAAIAESLRTSEQAVRLLVSKGLKALRADLADLRSSPVGS